MYRVQQVSLKSYNEYYTWHGDLRDGLLLSREIESYCDLSASRYNKVLCLSLMFVTRKKMVLVSDRVRCKA